MSENPRSDEKRDIPVEELRTEEPQAPFGADEPNPAVVSEETVDEESPGEEAEPGISGYAGRDPKEEMPHISSVPETHDDPRPHDAAPPARKDRWAGD